MNQLLTHDLDDGGFMVCHKMRIVEPITLSILNLLGAPQMNTIDEWLEDAVSRGSLVAPAMQLTRRSYLI